MFDLFKLLILETVFAIFTMTATPSRTASEIKDEAYSKHLCTVCGLTQQVTFGNRCCV